MKLKTIGVASFLTVALVFSACGKKKETRAQNVAQPEAKQAGVVPPNPSQTKIVPTQSAPVSGIDGLWWTDCTENAGKVYARRIQVERDVLTYGEFTYSDMDTCKADDIDGSMGTLSSNPNQNFLTKFALVAIQDGVMTHRVDYIAQDSQVSFQWVLRLEAGKSFLSSKIGFLTSRNTSEYNDTYYKY